MAPVKTGYVPILWIKQTMGAHYSHMVMIMSNPTYYWSYWMYHLSGETIWNNIMATGTINIQGGELRKNFRLGGRYSPLIEVGNDY